MAVLTGLRLLPGADAVLREHAAELPQRDELCGAFCALVALRAAGACAGLDQDDVALAAGTRLSPPPRPRSQPPGADGRDDFRLSLPEASDAAAAGTSAVGVAHAIETLSDGALAAVPASGEWTPAVLRRLLTAPAVAVLANVATGEFWDQAAVPEAVEQYLDTGVDGGVEASQWQVGHFVLFAGVRDGAAGSLVLVADTYPTLGDAGRHLQPVGRAAAALRGRGLLLVVPAERRAGTEELVAAAGLHAQLWDNGTPFIAAPCP